MNHPKGLMWCKFAKYYPSVRWTFRLMIQPPPKYWKFRIPLKYGTGSMLADTIWGIDEGTPITFVGPWIPSVFCLYISTKTQPFSAHKKKTEVFPWWEMNSSKVFFYKEHPQNTLKYHFFDFCCNHAWNSWFIGRTHNHLPSEVGVWE